MNLAQYSTLSKADQLAWRKENGIKAYSDLFKTASTPVRKSTFDPKAAQAVATRLASEAFSK
jgi:hypothetical protein